MKTTMKFVVGCLIGSITGGSLGCTLILQAQLEEDLAAAQCWCGEQWQVQVAGATAYRADGSSVDVPASDTSYARCVSMLEHVALDLADPQDPLYMALHDAFQSEAVANCEIAGTMLLLADFDHTDCATTGSGSVATNLVHLGPCWEQNTSDTVEDMCALDQQCGQYYDCEDNPIVLRNGRVRLGGGDDDETGGDTYQWISWTGVEELWSCVEPASNLDGPDTIRY